ncbi:MAG TPA: amidohydrolase family protein [Myxococcota bacterium]|nr:amidohydrolase family protein [Myxococcota bacterium]
MPETLYAAAMIIDAHVHVFPPEIVSGRQSVAALEPVFGWLYKDPGARLVTAAELVAELDKQKIDAAIVCGFPWRDTGRARMHNDYIIEAARRHPGRLVPLAAVDPLAPGALDEARRALREGAAGLGEIGVYQNDLAEPVVMKKMRELANLCYEAGCPLLLHTNEPVGHRYPGKSPMTLSGLYELVQSCPDTRFQLAHMGGGIFFFELLKKEVASVLANCVCDTAAAPFLYRPDVYRIFAELAGEERLLFGSDFPLLGIDRYRKEFSLSGILNEFSDKIMGENANSFWSVGTRDP